MSDDLTLIPRLLLSNSAILNFLLVLNHASVPGNEHAVSLAKTGASLPTAMVPCLSLLPLPKSVTLSATN